MRLFVFIAVAAATVVAEAQSWRTAPTTLPSPAVKRLEDGLAAAKPHRSHVWRDTPSMNADGTVNAYIEIAMGDRRKWEFDIAANARRIDRTMPASLGGYPVNYGYVPQTISYDGDPFDVLVVGPPLEGGTSVRGTILGVMFMEDEKGLDSKVVISRVDAAGRPIHQLTEEDRRRIGGYFARYKEHEPGAFSRVPGWGTAAEGRGYVETTRRFFVECQKGRSPLQSEATIRCGD